MIESIPNPLNDLGVKKEIKEKVDELMSRNINPATYNGLSDYIEKLIKYAADWGMATGFRMGWRVYEVTKGGNL